MIFWSVCLSWAILYAFIPPAASTTDVIVFSGGGANWAMGLGFVNATTPDNPTLNFKPYGSYPPLYSFLFGLWSKAFGLGEHQNTYFHLLIGTLRNALLLLIMLRFVGSQIPSQILPVIAFLAGFTSPYPTEDRTESLCALFFEAGLLGYALLRVKRWKYIAIGTSIGLMGITSPFAVIAGTLLYVGIASADLYGQPLGKWLTGFGWVSLSAIVFATPALIYYIAYPEALDSLVHHGTTSGGLGIVFKRVIGGEIKAIFEAMLNASAAKPFQYLSIYFVAFATFAFLTGLLLFQRNHSSATVFIASLTIFALGLMIGQPNYFLYEGYAFASVYFFYASSKASQNGNIKRLSTLAVAFLITVPFTTTVFRSAYARLYYANELNRISSAVKQIFFEYRDVKYAICNPQQYLLIRPFVPVFYQHHADSLRNYLKQANIVEVLYADSTDYTPKSFINKLLLRPSSDVKMRHISKVGEYLLVE